MNSQQRRQRPAGDPGTRRITIDGNVRARLLRHSLHRRRHVSNGAMLVVGVSTGRRDGDRVPHGADIVTR